MKVLNLSLANYRGFEQIDIPLERDVTVIAGVNGVGKSGVLHALQVLMSRALPEFTAFPHQAAESFEDDDIKRDRPKLEASMVFTHADLQGYRATQRLRIGDGDLTFGLWQAVADGDVAEAMSFKELLESRTLGGEENEAQKELRAAVQEQKSATDQPVAIFFGTNRQLQGKPNALPKIEPFTIQKAFAGALSDRDVDLREFMHWFKVWTSESMPNHAQATRVLNQLKKAVKQFEPTFKDIWLEERPTLRFVVDKAGQPLAINQLSIGERSLLALFFDIARRLAIAHPTVADPVANGKGVVLIDEVELHLHPAWQRKVLRRLQSTFPKVQFVVTTHSPQVLGEVEGRCIRYLRPIAEGKVEVVVPDHALGIDSSRILEELMEVPPRNEKTMAKLKDLFEAIDKEEFGLAKERLRALSITLGEHDAEITRATALLKFLEDVG